MKHEIINHIPEIATLAGYAAGQAMEQLALRDIAQTRHALFPAHESDTQATEQPEATRYGLLRRSVATLALIGAAAGYANGEAWKPTYDRQTIEPHLALAMDHSYAAGANGHANKMNTIAEHIARNKQLRLQVVVGHNGSYDAIKIAELKQDQPYGPTSIKEATSVALGNVFSASEPLPAPGAKPEKKRNAAVLVMTDGNTIGEVRSVKEKAQRQGDVPVMIVNTGKNQGPVAKTLRAIAKRTGGKYWDSKESPKKIAAYIAERVTVKKIERKVDGGDRTPLKILGAGLVLLALRQFKRRKHEAIIS